MLQAEEPSSDRIRTMEFAGAGGGKMYIRVQRWDEARVVRVAYFDPTPCRIVFKTMGFDQYSEGLKAIAKTVGRELGKVM